MSRLFSAMLVLIGALLLVSGVGAQSIHQPVYAYREGDIWRYDLTANTATQLTEWGYNGGPILSPDGRKIAYLSTSAEFVAQFEAGNVTQTSGTAPANVWVMDIATESFTLVADQTGASGARLPPLIAGWSPDSRRLAWLQIDPNVQDLDSATLQFTASTAARLRFSTAPSTLACKNRISGCQAFAGVKAESPGCSSST